MRPKKTISVYVLKLHGDKYYVGQSRHPERRIKDHFEGKGSAWTQLNTTVEVVRVIPTTATSWRAALEIETSLTLELMRVFGWQNVRGGGYSSCHIASPPQGVSAAGVDTQRKGSFLVGNDPL